MCGMDRSVKWVDWSGGGASLGDTANAASSIGDETSLARNWNTGNMELEHDRAAVSGALYLILGLICDRSRSVQGPGLDSGAPCFPAWHAQRDASAFLLVVVGFGKATSEAELLLSVGIVTSVHSKHARTSSPASNMAARVGMATRARPATRDV